MSDFPNKRIKKDNYNQIIQSYNPEYFSVSGLYNYFTNDTLIDYLNKYGHSKGYCKDDNSNEISKKYNFRNFIMDLGGKYEKKVIQKIITNLNEKEYYIIKSDKFQHFETSLKLTVRALENKIPVIFQAYLFSNKLNLHGYCDILVRVDYIGKLFECDDLENIVDMCLKNGVEYLPIDIKISNLDSTFNPQISDYYQFIYAQLASYTQMLNEMTRTECTHAFLLGKQFFYSSKLSLIKVPIENYIFDKIKKGIEWLSDLSLNGNKWNLSPPSKLELMPNMKNTNDSDWSSLKRKLSEVNHEITSIMYLTKDKRDYFYEKGITNYLNPELLNELTRYYKPTSRLYTNIQNIIQSQYDTYNYDYSILHQRQNKFKNDIDIKYVYIDIETVYNHLKFVYDDFTNIKNEFIVQIGIGFINQKNEWIYRSFDINKLDENLEEDMIAQFKNYIYALFDIYKEVCLVHFTSAEDKVFKKIIKEGKKKYITSEGEMERKVSYLDLHSEFIDKKIYFKGLLNFKLKEIVKVMNAHKLTDLSYNNLKIKDGLTLMCIYLKHPEGLLSDQMDNIRMYNETDCKALYELHKIL